MQNTNQTQLKIRYETRGQRSQDQTTGIEQRFNPDLYTDCR